MATREGASCSGGGSPRKPTPAVDPADSNVTTPEPSPADVLVPHERHRWVAPLFMIVALGLVPWTIYLAVTLPSRHVQQNSYDLAWAGFDIALAAAIIATGIGVLWQRLWVQAAATCAATLLVCDAWFDVLSSNPGSRSAGSDPAGRCSPSCRRPHSASTSRVTRRRWPRAHRDTPSSRAASAGAAARKGPKLLVRLRGPGPADPADRLAPGMAAARRRRELVEAEDAPASVDCDPSQA